MKIKKLFKLDNKIRLFNCNVFSMLCTDSVDISNSTETNRFQVLQFICSLGRIFVLALIPKTIV